MRAAPPTTWPLARQGLWRLAHATVPALAGASLGGALMPWPLPAAFGAALLAAVLADRLWQRRKPSTLTWDGVQWQLDAREGSRRGRASLVWDGGRWLMARWHDGASGADRWLLLDRADGASVAGWHALRVALVQGAGVRSDVLPGTSSAEVA